MLKFLLVFCVFAVLTNCDDQSEHVYINVLIEKYLKMEKDAWDTLSKSNDRNENMRPIKHIFADPYLNANNSLLYGRVIQNNELTDNDDQWKIASKYIIGNSFSRANALMHANNILDKDYSKYWNLSGVDYFQIGKKVRLSVNVA